MKARSAAEALDRELVDYYKSLYSALGDEELAVLSAMRATLVKEAVKALQDVLASRHIAPALGPELAAQLTASADSHHARIVEELSHGQAATSARIFATIAALTAAVIVLARFPLGTVLVVVLSLAVGYGGYRFASVCTDKICANEARTVAQRRSQLRWFAAVILALYVLLFAAVMRQYIR